MGTMSTSYRDTDQYARRFNRIHLQYKRCIKTRKRISDDQDVCVPKCKRCKRCRDYQKRKPDRQQQADQTARARGEVKVERKAMRRKPVRRKAGPVTVRKIGESA